MPTTHKTTDEAALQLTRDDMQWGGYNPGTGYGPLTFGFRASPPTYNDTKSMEGLTFSKVNAAEMAAAETALQLWADVANITFKEVNPGGYTDNATILFGNYYSAIDNYGGFSPGWSSASGDTSGTAQDGDVWLNLYASSWTNFSFGGSQFATFLHETGHALGLAHPGDYDASMGSVTYGANAEYVEDTTQYSVMSYFGASNSGANYVYGGSVVSFSTPLLDDIAALQLLYGANMDTRTGSTTYGFHSTAGAAYNIASATDQKVFCIWDAGGNDTLDLSGYSTDQRISLPLIPSRMPAH